MRLSRWMDFDPVTWLIVVLLLAIGLTTIYSTTVDARGGRYVYRQLLAIGLGLLASAAFGLISYEKWLAWAPTLYVGSMALLIGTLIFGHAVSGSKSWLVAGPFRLQPSEIAKLAVILMWARIYGGRHAERLRTHRFSLRDLLSTSAVAALPIGLILLQPDFGTALTFLFPLAVLWFFLRMPWRYWLVLGWVGLMAMPVGWSMLKPYQKARVLTFLKSEAIDPRGAGYQVLQSKIALGAGGFWGKGFRQGSQAQLGFVPERHTDFVLASFGEEWGFVGIVLIFLLYMGLLARWFTLAGRTPDPAGQMLIALVLAFWIFHFGINAGMVIGWFPVTGLPLPLVSYGGSFLLFCLSSVGLVLNVYWRRHEVAARL
ncbi:MAG: rod shape-determining protein RodA [Acidobacteria bacterium]|nr:rod shape-determining protein RodA [Acidobacteriota bacterium]MDW7984954.1 rod shape-determining protein RodA [Acidobacteriota bacterium]